MDRAQDELAVPAEAVFSEGDSAGGVSPAGRELRAGAGDDRAAGRDDGFDKGRP